MACSPPCVLCELLLSCRSGNEEKLMALLTPLNVNCHASDGRKVSTHTHTHTHTRTHTLTHTQTQTQRQTQTQTQTDTQREREGDTQKKLKVVLVSDTGKYKEGKKEIGSRPHAICRQQPL